MHGNEFAYARLLVQLQAERNAELAKRRLIRLAQENDADPPLGRLTRWRSRNGRQRRPAALPERGLPE